MGAVTSDEVSRVSAQLGGGLDGADGADQVLLEGGLGLDVVWEVVGQLALATVALTAASRGAAALGSQSFDAVLVFWVDNGADVKEVEAIPPVPADLTKHAGNVVGAFGDGIKVANPAGGELDRCVGQTGKGEGWDRLEAFLSSEDDCAFGGVLTDEFDGVGAGQSGEGCQDGGG